MSIHKRMDKINSYKEYDGGVKINELQIHGSIWLNLRNILVKEKTSQEYTHMVVSKWGKRFSKHNIQKSCEET